MAGNITSHLPKRCKHHRNIGINLHGKKKTFFDVNVFFPPPRLCFGHIRLSVYVFFYICNYHKTN